MKPYQIYFLEFNFRFFYILISYFFCLGVLFLNIDSIFLFETNSLLLILTTKRLILTEISQLFNTIWFLSNLLCFITIFPLIFYHILTFFKSSWYLYQIHVFSNFTLVLFSFFVIFNVASHIFVIPNLITFFLYWEIKEISSLLRIEAEISLFHYCLWSLNFKFLFGYFFANLIILIHLVLKFFNIFSLYRLFLNSKRMLNYLFICILFILIPPDFLLQIFITVISYILFEFVFLTICIKSYTKSNYI